MKSRANRFLILALICFLGIIAVFVVDGYLGVYDTLVIQSGESTQTFEADFWQNGSNYASIGAGPGELVNCSYTIDNRWFSNYRTTVEATLWRGQQQIMSLLSQPIDLSPFQKTVLTFTIDTTDLAPADNSSLDYTLVIKRGDIERRLIVYVSGLPVPGKVGP